MSTSFDLNRTEIIRTASQLVGVVAAGDDPDTALLSMGSDFLNVILKEMQSYGIILRKLERTTIPLVSGTASYTLDASTLDVDTDTSYVSDGNGTDLRLMMIPRGQYMAITDKTTQGQPTQMYVEKTANITVSLYPVPDGNWPTMTIPRVVVIDDMTTASSVTGLQAKYLRAIMLGVAHMIAYAHSLNDKARMLKADYDQALGIAKNDDTERGPTRLLPAYGLRMRR